MPNTVHARKPETESPDSTYSYDDYENDSGDEIDSDFEESSQTAKNDSFQNRPNSRDKIHHLERKTKSSPSNPEKDQEDADYLNQVANSDDNVDNGGEDPQNSSDKSDNNDDPNPSPSRVEKDGTKVYEPTGEEKDVNLKASDKGDKFVVKTTGRFSVSPVDPNDSVVISEEGDKKIISMIHGDKTTTFTVEASASIEINSKNVTGSVNNDDGKITVGSNDQLETYIPGDKRGEIANKLSTTISQIGYIDYKESHMIGGIHMPGDEITNPPGALYTVGFQGGATIHAAGGSIDESKKEASDVKDWMGQLAAAVREPDSKKRGDLFDKLVKNINDANLNESEGGYLNNRGNLIARVIASAVGGADAVADLRKKGILPDNFCKKVAEMLKASPEENKKLNDVTEWQGGPGNDKTHAYWADKFEGSLSNSSSETE